jgi:putative membrane protein
MGHVGRALMSIPAAAMALAIAAACGGNTPSPATAGETEAAQDEQRAQDEAPAGDEAQFALALISAAYAGEEELAEVATERAQSDRVRAHAEDLLEDYERLDPEVDAVAEQVNVDLEEPQGVAAAVNSELESAYTELRTVLEQAGDDEFDQAYLRSLIATHQATISELERIEDQIDESEVRQLVERHLPLLRRQLERARDVANREGFPV